MTQFSGVVTNGASLKLAQVYGQTAAWAPVSYFKVGMGGWIDPGTGKVPRVPSAALTDLDVIVNPSRYSYPTGTITSFRKNLEGSDLSVMLPPPNPILRVSMLLDFTEYNDDGWGLGPWIWELGVFDSSDTMLFYGTIVGEQKTNAKQILNVCNVTFPQR